MAAAPDLALDIAYGMDPIRWASACGMTPEPSQAAVLASTAKRLVLCCTRQWGKSTWTAGRAAHRAIYRPNSLILCLGAAQRQSGELFGKVDWFLSHAPSCPKSVKASAEEIRLANGSRIVCLPDNHETVRGYSAPQMVCIDEAAFADDKLFDAVAPMLIRSKGDLILMSTPYGKRGAFYEAWIAPDGIWQRHRARAVHEAPWVTMDEIEREKRSRNLPDWIIRQEYFCDFVETLDSVFTADQVAGAIVDGEELAL